MLLEWYLRKYKTMSRVSKIIFTITTFFSVFFYASPAFALTYLCSDLSSQLISGEAPSPIAIMCIVARIINVFVLSVGAVLIVTIMYGGIKLSTSFGDVKGFQGGKKTWEYAVIGAGVVIGFIAIYTIMANILGLPAIGLNDLLERIERWLIQLMMNAEITNYMD